MKFSTECKWNRSPSSYHHYQRPTPKKKDSRAIIAEKDPCARHVAPNLFAAAKSYRLHLGNRTERARSGLCPLFRSAARSHSGVRENRWAYPWFYLSLLAYVQYTSERESEREREREQQPASFNFARQLWPFPRVAAADLKWPFERTREGRQRIKG